MKTVDCSPIFLPFLCKQLAYVPTAYAQCIICIHDGKAIAGVIYDNYNEVSVGAHIWIGADSMPSREWYAAIFDYPFNQLGVKKLVGQVPSSNSAASKLDKHFGFTEEARITDYSHDGDLILYTMTKDECKVLNDPKWSRVVANLKRVS
jgi:RimJ/RimL family protein N-acetyltransferase